MPVIVRSDADIMFELRAYHIFYTSKERVAPGVSLVSQGVYNMVGIAAMQEVVREQLLAKKPVDETYTKKEAMRRLGLLYGKKIVNEINKNAGIGKIE